MCILELKKSEGQINIFLITNYPPGTSIILPNEKITNKKIKYLRKQIKKGQIIQGVIKKKQKIYIQCF